MWWCVPVIPATKEAGDRKDQGLTLAWTKKRKVSETPSKKELQQGLLLILSLHKIRDKGKIVSAW
jgi:hypothetical protein